GSLMVRNVIDRRSDLRPSARATQIASIADVRGLRSVSRRSGHRTDRSSGRFALFDTPVAGLTSPQRRDTGGSLAKHRLHASLAAAIAACVALAPAVALPAPEGAPSIEDLFRKPDYLGAALSPSGRYLAVIAPVGERRGLGIIDLDARTAAPSLRGFAGDIVRVTWQTDDRLL